MLEDTQEKMIELNAEIAVYKNAPEEASKFFFIVFYVSLIHSPLILDKKGNSLFAEVDDQRQKMKAILSAQNKQYLQVRVFFF